MNVHTLSVAGEQYPLQDSSAREQLEGLSENLETLATKVSTNLKASVEVITGSLTGGTWSQGTTTLYLPLSTSPFKADDIIIFGTFGGASAFIVAKMGAGAPGYSFYPITNSSLLSFSYENQYNRWKITWGGPGETSVEYRILRLNTLATS